MTPDAPFCEIVVGSPVPKGRARVGKRGNVYTPQRTRDFQDRVAWLAMKAMRRRPPLTCSLRVHVDVRYKRDADLDNFIKAALDGMNRIVFADDRQVVGLSAQKTKCYPGYEPTMLIRVWPSGGR